MVFNKVAWNDLSSTEKIVFLPLVVLIIAFFTFVENWFIMVFLGSVHSVISFVPALGFWLVVWWNFLISLIIKIIRRTYG